MLQPTPGPGCLWDFLYKKKTNKTFITRAGRHSRYVARDVFAETCTSVHAMFNSVQSETFNWHEHGCTRWKLRLAVWERDAALVVKIYWCVAWSICEVCTFNHTSNTCCFLLWMRKVKLLTVGFKTSNTNLVHTSVLKDEPAKCTPIPLMVAPTWRSARALSSIATCCTLEPPPQSEAMLSSNMFRRLNLVLDLIFPPAHTVLVQRVSFISNSF